MKLIIKIFCTLLFMLSFAGIAFGFYEILNGIFFIQEGYIGGGILVPLGFLIFALSGKVTGESMKVILS